MRATTPSSDGRPRGALRPRRSVLFVPATRPDRFPKAIAAGADAVCIDLEDAVAPGRKADARERAVRLLTERARDRERAAAEVILRINAPGTPEGERDLDALLAGGSAPDALMLPKLSGPEPVEEVTARLGGPAMEHVALVPMVETAEGLHRAEAIATASPRTSAILFGGVDLSTELRVRIGWDALLYARSRIVHAACLAGVDVIDMPFLDVADPEGLAEETRRVHGIGFTGKTAIHPAQIGPIHRAMTPSADEVSRARAVVDTFEAGGEGVLLHEGRLLEKPVIESARRTLALAALGAAGPGMAEATGSAPAPRTPAGAPRHGEGP